MLVWLILCHSLNFPFHSLLRGCKYAQALPFQTRSGNGVIDYTGNIVNMWQNSNK